MSIIRHLTDLALEAFPFLRLERGSGSPLAIESRMVQGTVLAERYIIEQLIGIGGMSSVYLATDLNLPGKKWAVKESQMLNSTISVSNLASEAHVLISLSHHRLPRIVDYITDEDNGYCYLVMDYVEGVHLDKFVREKNGLLFGELIRMGIQICEGLQYLHGQHPPIIHRDLKPSNLLINSKLEISFIDFGIARQYKEHSLEDTVKLGTVGFAAPEQYGGQQSDGRSDLYSLGALLTYLGTNGQYTYWCSDAEQMLKNNGFVLILPVLQRLLMYDPNDRYRSAEEVAEVLRSLLIPNQLHEPGERKTRSYGKHKYIPKQRTFVIAVMGTSAGVGATHVSISVAHILSRFARKVAFVDMGVRSSVFQHLSESLLAEKCDTPSDSLSLLSQFQIHHVQYFSSPARSQLLGLFTKDFEFIICDLGSGHRKDWVDEFQRADLSVLVTSGAEWRHDELMTSAELLNQVISKSNQICFVPMTTGERSKQIRKRVGSHEIYPFPAEMNPYMPSDLTEEAFFEACGNKLPQSIMIQRNEGRNSKRKWRRHK